jgi:2-oxoisovalerate dehydrogenase E2 component (dihydrolipoyl transacylase)
VGRYTFRLPDIGEGIAEAEIVAWHVRLGDRIEEDGRLADMMTDKATVEMESPVSGIVVELAGEEGDKVAIGAPLAVIEVEGEFEAETLTPALSQGEREQAPPPEEMPQKPSPPGRGLGEGPSLQSTSRVLASPAVRARARSLGIDLAAVRANADGRIGHADLDAYLTARTPVDQPVEKSGNKPVELLSGAGEQIKVIGLRRRIAENMAASKRHIPHFSYVEECDVTALETLRAELNAIGGARVKITLLPLLITAICRALAGFPMINARYDDAAGLVTRYSSVHLGVATQTDAGLMVPVIRDAQSLGLGELAEEIARVAAAARDGSARPDELSGSTLTLTSLGPLGGIATTPVINRPEVAIIGPNRIVERPVYVGEVIERRKLMNLSISCDHRVVDGYDAASFIQAVKALLEAPLSLLKL